MANSENNLISSLVNVSIDDEKTDDMDLELYTLSDEENLLVSSNGTAQPSNADLMQFLVKMNSNLAANEIFKSTATKSLADLKSKTDTHTNQIAKLEAQMAEFKSTSMPLADGWTEQRKLRNNINIIGIQPSQGENLTNIVLDLFIFFGLTIAAADIESVYRVKYAKSNMMIVKFVKFDTKLKLISAKKSKKVTVGDIPSVAGLPANMTKEIFINTHVTPFVGRLLYRGRMAVKNRKLAACWMSANSLLVKTNADAEPIAVKSMSDFDEILGPAEVENEPTFTASVKRRINDISPSNKTDVQPRNKPRRSSNGRSSPGPLSSKTKKDKNAQKEKK